MLTIHVESQKKNMICFRDLKVLDVFRYISGTNDYFYLKISESNAINNSIRLTDGLLQSFNLSTVIEMASIAKLHISFREE